MSEPSPAYRLNPGLRILRTGPQDFRLIDPYRGTHFEFHAEERFLLAMLERGEPWEVARAAYRNKFGRELDRREGEEFLAQLQLNHLLIDEQPLVVASAEPVALLKSPRLAIKGEAANILCDLLALFFGWLLHPLMLVVVVLLALMGGTLLVLHWHQGVADLAVLWHRFPTLPLFFGNYLQTVVLLNLPLALMYGMACRQFRGRVRNVAFTWGNWVLPTFSFATDTGDSLVFMEPRDRRAFVLVGLATPIALGSLYISLWVGSSRSSDAYQFWVLMVPSVLLVTLYQCNIFSPFAAAGWGLCLAVEDWNLRNRAIAETNAWLARRTSPEALTARERFWLRAYGLGDYLLRFGIDALMLFGGGTFVIACYGAHGFAIFLLLVLFWNRARLAPLWRLLGLSRSAPNPNRGNALAPVGAPAGPAKFDPATR
ncbi:MAG TPA: hypothetical protein VFE24_11715 [Pirellulales bacterium]|jgi:hypothetical protein|nr:hypothetical protein [Pirellulales bacterium]